MQTLSNIFGSINFITQKFDRLQNLSLIKRVLTLAKKF